MDLRWKEEGDEIGTLDEQILKRMICFRLTDAIGHMPLWFIYFVERKPELVAVVLYEYASRALAAKQETIDGIHQPGFDPRFQQVALIVVPMLLRSFPIRVKSSHLPYLEILLKAGWHYQVPEMVQLIEKKIVLRSVDASQKMYWLIIGMLIAPDKYEQALWDFVGKSWQRANSISEFLKNLFIDLPLDYTLNSDLSARSLSKLIELLTPHAELEQQGLVTETTRLGEYVRILISRLAQLNTADSFKEMQRLRSLPSMTKIKFYLKKT